MVENAKGVKKIKNPAFGVYSNDDENNIDHNVVDRSKNVEIAALNNIMGGKRKELNYPFATSNFVVRMLNDQSTEIIILDGHFETIWKSPIPPCRKGDLIKILCDGHIPTCEPYQSLPENMVKAGYSPTGCRAFRKCCNWSKSKKQSF